MRARRVIDQETGSVVARAAVIRRRDRMHARKLTYTSKKLAKMEAARQSKASGEPIQAFHCYPCHGYHLGHEPGWQDERAS